MNIIEEKAAQVYKEAIKSMREFGIKRPEPFAFRINEVVLYINPPKSPWVSLAEPLKFNPLDAAHIEALQIALCIYKYMEYCRSILWTYENGLNQWFEISSEDIAGLMEMADEAMSSFVFEYLPEDVSDKLYAAFDMLEREYNSALALEAEMCQEAIQLSKNSGYVYLIQSPTGSYKIGRTKDPSNRMKTFTVKLPFEVDYVCVIETADMYRLEGDLHLRFNSKRVNGEWFRLEPQDVEHIKSLAGAS